MVATIPTVPDLARYLKTDRVDPEDLSDALETALEQQALRCVTVPYTASLAEAAKRRAARILAARGAPLGALDLGPLGSSPLIRYDALIEENEGPYRRTPTGTGVDVAESGVVPLLHPRRYSADWEMP